MQKVLEQLNTVPEVIGSMVCTESGSVSAHIFPAIFDQSLLHKAATAITGSALWSGQLTGSTGLLDLRYGDGRIIGRTLRGGLLFVLCTKAVNLQLLNISLNVAKNRLENLMPTVAAPPQSPPIVQAVTSPVVTAESTSVNMLLVDEMDTNTEAGRGFQELGMAALSANTAQKLCTQFHVGAIKKLKLSKPSNGNSGTFGIMIFSDESGRYDGKIVLSRQIEKKLQAIKDDRIQVDIG